MVHDTVVISLKHKDIGKLSIEEQNIVWTGCKLSNVVSHRVRCMHTPSIEERTESNGRSLLIAL
jgi:hypothetical protein